MRWRSKLTSTKQAAQLNGLKICVMARQAPAEIAPVRNNWRRPSLSALNWLLSLRDADIPVIEVQTLRDVFDAYQFVSQSAEAAHF